MSDIGEPASLPPLIAARFRLVRHLRSGGMGQVWAAHDLEWDAPVVLKVPHLSTERAAAELRREFRAFALLDHENVARFYDLVGDDHRCAYSMEYIDGDEFSVCVRGTLGYRVPADADTIARLLPIAAQLVAGVDALHEAGLIHRDLKPANVLVDRSGRVVIVDPGIAAPLLHDGTAEQRASAGTLDYMAPEQVLGEPESTATDWYSVGAMLYEALTGRPVFEGSFSDIVGNWQKRRPIDLAALPPAVAEVWRPIFTPLLDPVPAARAPGVALLRTLLAGRSQGPASGLPFVGRATELARLDEAWAAGPGRRVVVVTGPPGSGKSRLVAAWTASRRRAEGARVLRGRCDPRESVPFRGLDAVLALRPPPEPKLGRRRAANLPVTAEAQARVFADLRNRLLELAGQGPVVVVVDGAHWAAHDTRVLLAELTRPPLPASLLFVITARPGATPVVPADAVHTDLPIGDLPAADAVALLAARMPLAEAERLAARVGGLPILLDELARAAAPASGTTSPADLDTLVDARLARLPPEQRQVYALVSLAGGPVGSGALRVLGIPHALGAVTGLLSARMLRLEPGPTHVGVVPAHQRFAERGTASLAAGERQALHRALADALIASDDPRLDLVTTHLELGGAGTDAAAYALRAAEVAREQFAFGAAAEAFERAFRLDPALATPARRTEHAQVLAALGLGSRAGAAFLQAAGGPQGDTRLVVAAAEQYLRSAQADAGTELLTGVLQARGYVAPPRGVRLLLGILWTHLRIALRWVPRNPDPNTIDALLIAAAGLSPIDALVSHWFGAHYSLAASAHPAAHHRARAAALETILLSRFGAWVGQRALRRMQESFDLARATGDAEDLAYTWVAAGAVHWSRQDVRATLHACDEALAIYDGIVSHSVHWERSVCRLWHFGALSLAGETERAVALADAVARDAELRSDPWALNAGLFGAVSRAAVVRGDYVAATRAITEMAARCEGHSNYVGAVLIDEAEADVALAQGDIVGAWAALARGRPRREHHRPEAIPALAVSYYSRRAALAAAVATGRGNLDEAERAAARRIAVSDRAAMRRLDAVNVIEIVGILEAHARLLAGDPPDRWDAPLADLEARCLTNHHGHWAAAARALRLAARGERDTSWCGGRYVDLFLPGLVPAVPSGSGLADQGVGSPVRAT